MFTQTFKNFFKGFDRRSNHLKEFFKYLPKHLETFLNVLHCTPKHLKTFLKHEATQLKTFLNDLTLRAKDSKTFLNV